MITQWATCTSIRLDIILVKGFTRPKYAQARNRPEICIFAYFFLNFKLFSIFFDRHQTPKRDLPLPPPPQFWTFYLALNDVAYTRTLPTCPGRGTHILRHTGMCRIFGSTFF